MIKLFKALKFMIIISLKKLLIQQIHIKTKAKKTTFKWFFVLILVYFWFLFN